MKINETPPNNIESDCIVIFPAKNEVLNTKLQKGVIDYKISSANNLPIITTPDSSDFLIKIPFNRVIILFLKNGQNTCCKEFARSVFDKMAIEGWQCCIVASHSNDIDSVIYNLRKYRINIYRSITI